MIPSQELAEASAWVLPPEPPWVRTLARAAVAGLVLLALIWWVSLARDVWLGRSPLWWALASAAVLLAWGMSAWRGLGSHNVAAEGGDDVAWHSLYWREHWSDQDVPAGSRSPWRNNDGDPVDLTVRMDLGVCLLLRLTLRDRRVTVHRWVREADLPGPWRWRLTMSAAVAGLSEAHREIVASSQPSSSSLSSLSHPTQQAPRSPQERA